MSLDNDIRRSLQRHAEDVQPDARAFDRVEQRVRRAHAQRVAIGVSLIVALIAAASVVIPRLGNDPRNDGFAGPDGTTSPSPTPAPDDGWVTVRDEQDGYQLRMPPDWRVTEFEGAVELLPPGMVGTAAGEDTFAVELMLFHDERFEAETNMTIGDRPARRDERANGQTYRADWSGSVCEPCTLQIAVIAPATDNYPTTLLDTTGHLIASIEHIVEASLPVGEVRTRRGVVAADVGYDERTALLVRFLEARTHGGGAEEFLSPAFSEGKDLYTIDGEAILTFEVTARAEADANSSEFTVVLDGIATETVAVGAGSGGLQIRFIQPGG